MKFVTMTIWIPGRKAEQQEQMRQAVRRAFAGVSRKQAAVQWQARCRNAGRETGARVHFTTKDGLPCVVFNFTPQPFGALSGYFDGRQQREVTA